MMCQAGVSHDRFQPLDPFLDVLVLQMGEQLVDVQQFVSHVRMRSPGRTRGGLQDFHPGRGW